MSRYFSIVITGGTSAGPYSFYYDYVSSDHIAHLFPSNLPASGLSSTSSYEISVPGYTCQSGYTFVADPSQPNGIGYCSLGGCPPNSYPVGGGLCLVCFTPCPNPDPIPISKIIIQNDGCQTTQSFDVGVIPVEQSCFCLTIKTGTTYNVYNSTYQYQFCSNGTFLHGKPVYETTVSGHTYTIVWDSIYSFWAIQDNLGITLPLPHGLNAIRSYDSGSIPLSSWNLYFTSWPYPFNNITAVSGYCTNPLTLSYGEQIVLQNDPVDINCTFKNPSCVGLSDGSIISKASGGYGGWQYSLNNVFFNNSTGIFSNLSAGTYTVYAQDIGGNVTSCVVTLKDSLPVNFTLPLVTNSKINNLGSLFGGTVYGLEFSINNSKIPLGSTVTFDMSLNFQNKYSEPGLVIFLNAGQLTISNQIFNFDYVSGTTPTKIGPSTCSPSLYGVYASSDNWVLNDITISNTDVISGLIIFLINTDSGGQFENSCITQGTENVTLTINNLRVEGDNLSTCYTTNPTNISFNKTQIYSGIQMNNLPFFPTNLTISELFNQSILKKSKK
jgi:SprB repeat